MSTIKKPDYTIFAKDAKSDELQPFPNISRGWGITLEQTAGMPPLEWANYIQKRTDEWLMYLTQNGLAEWDESLDYSKGALSQVDGVIYRAKEAVKGESPSASAKWEKLLADKVGTSDFIGMSQSAIKKELDKKFDTAALTQTITADKLKAPSNFAVSEALKSVMLEIGSVTPVGSMMWSISPKQPKGRWLKMNGAEVSRSAYKDLFDEISTLYGKGDGTTTFNIPDARGYFPRFWDDGRGIDSGRTFGSFQEDAIVQHKHYRGVNPDTYKFNAIASGNNTTNQSSTGATPTEVVTSETATAEETRPKNLAINAWIKY